MISKKVITVLFLRVFWNPKSRMDSDDYRLKIEGELSMNENDQFVTIRTKSANGVQSVNCKGAYVIGPARYEQEGECILKHYTLRQPDLCTVDRSEIIKGFKEAGWELVSEYQFKG